LWQLVSNGEFSYSSKGKRNKLKKDYEYEHGLFRTKRHHHFFYGTPDRARSRIGTYPARHIIPRGTFAGAIYGFGLLDSGRLTPADTGAQGGGQN
jgi:hypothetical protein